MSPERKRAGAEGNSARDESCTADEPEYGGGRSGSSGTSRPSRVARLVA